MIGTSGIRLLVDGKVDYSRSRNLVLTSVVFVTGLSGIALKIGNVEMTGMVLACVVAMAMSLVFYILDKFGLTNDQSQNKNDTAAGFSCGSLPQTGGKKDESGNYSGKLSFRALYV